MKRSTVLFLMTALLIAARLHAQPSSGEPAEKAKARTLLKEGVRLLDAGQLAPALRKFEDAYAAFPSAKILINIGTAQNGLGRWVDAANTYQRYLDSGADDTAQLPAVAAALADLDAKLGRLMLKVRGAGRSTSELRIVGRPASEPRTAARGWMPLPPSGVVRVAPGRFEVQVRASAGGREVSTSGTIAAREQREVVIELAARNPVRAAAPDPSEARAYDRTAAAQGTRSNDRTAAVPGARSDDRTAAMLGTRSNDRAAAVPGARSDDRTAAMLGTRSDDRTAAVPGARSDDRTAAMPGTRSDDRTAAVPGARSHDRTAAMPGTRSDDRTAAARGTPSDDRTAAAPETAPAPASRAATAHTPTETADEVRAEGSERRAAGESSTRRSRWTPLRQGAVVAGAIGGAGLIAMSVLALDARSMWNHAQPEKDLELARRAATRANLATEAGVLGAAALGTGIVLWFMGAPRDREPPAVTAIVDGNHVGLAVQGAF